MMRVPRIRLAPAILVALVALAVAPGCGGDSPTDTGGGSGGGSIRIDGTRVELEGYIESLGDSDLVVYGYVVVVTAATEIDGDRGEQLRFDDLLVGMWVEVRGTRRGDGAVVAERVEVDDEHDSSDSGTDEH